MKNDLSLCTVLTFTSVSIAFVLASALVFNFIENDWDYVTSLYFVVITMSTIGYGDVSPSTTSSKVFCMIFIFISLFILFAVFQALINYCVNRQFRRVKQQFEKRMKKRMALNNESLLDDDDVLSDNNDNNNNSLNTCTFNCFRSICDSQCTAVIAYLFLYIGWLVVWIYYFTKWNKTESKYFSIFDAIYFGIVTSSTVGYGVNHPQSGNNGEIFTLCWAIVGVVLLATLAGNVSNMVLVTLFRVCHFHKECCARSCCNCDACDFLASYLTEEGGNKEDDWRLEKETILNIKQHGAIDLRTFLIMEYGKDDEFIGKLERGCELFDSYDTDGNKSIEFEELKAQYRRKKQEKMMRKQKKRDDDAAAAGQTELVVSTGTQ